MGNNKNLIIIGVVLLIVMFGGCGYNGIVGTDQTVKEKWAQVENNYERRAALIPNLVNTVKGEANFEQSTLTQITEARAKATQMKVDVSNLTPEKMKEYEAAQGQLGNAIGRLLSVTENYPNLKANQGFRDLSAELSGTENRISTARKDFNEAVTGYNVKVKRFPMNILAGMFGFHERGFFQSTPGSDKAPTVTF